MKTMIWPISQKIMQTTEMEIAYLEAGPDGGQPIVLFHGFPDCARSYSEVMVELANRGYKTFAPFLRGFAPTRFLDEDTPRSGDMAALGQDALEFFDALDLKNAIVVGQDWGSAIAEILTFSRQSRISKLIKLNWHGVYAMAELAKSRSFNYQQMQKSWYIWLLNTPFGEPAVTFDTENFCRALWEQWSPSWNAEQMLVAFDEAKTSFQSPDFSKVVLSSYRSGMSGVGGDKRRDKLRSVIQQPPAITCDTVVLTGSDDAVEGAPLPEESIPHYFTGNFHHSVVKGAGHFIQRQRPHEVVCAILNEEF